MSTAVIYQRFVDMCAVSFNELSSEPSVNALSDLQEGSALYYQQFPPPFPLSPAD